jgi:hypothetical protein
MGRERLGFAAVNDVEQIDIVVPSSNLNNRIVTAKVSSFLSIAMQLRLNSHILNDLVQLFSKTSNILRKPSWLIVSNVFGLLRRCNALFI